MACALIFDAEIAEAFAVVGGGLVLQERIGFNFHNHNRLRPKDADHQSNDDKHIVGILRGKVNTSGRPMISP